MEMNLFISVVILLAYNQNQQKSYINQELEDWANLGVEGHTDGKNPWLSYHEFLTETTAKLVGAKPIEVVTMNSLNRQSSFYDGLVLQTDKKTL